MITLWGPLVLAILPTDAGRAVEDHRRGACAIRRTRRRLVPGQAILTGPADVDTDLGPGRQLDLAGDSQRSGRCEQLRRVRALREHLYPETRAIWATAAAAACGNCCPVIMRIT